MRSYALYKISAGGLVAALAASIVLHGGLQAVAAGLACVAGAACLASLIAAYAVGEHASDGRRPRTT
jgi:hypothetical protein